jgi:hypothetical protein
MVYLFNNRGTSTREVPTVARTREMPNRVSVPPTDQYLPPSASPGSLRGLTLRNDLPA